MATVRLKDPERPGYELPPVCIRCGAEATVYKVKKFSWYPRWALIVLLAGPLPFLIVVLVLTKRMRVRAPLCDRHRYHWGGRLALFWAAFVGLIFLIILAVSLSPTPMPDRTVGMVWLGALFGVLLLSVIATVLTTGMIRPVEITDYSITLQGVAQGFREAVRAARESRVRDLDRAVRERWNAPRGRRDEDDWDRYRDADDRDRRRRRSGDDYFPDDD